MDYPRLTLWVRRSHSYFHGVWDYQGKTDLPSIKYKSMIQAWNLFLKMSYSVFRRRVTEIAYSTYLPNRFDHICFWNDWEFFDMLPKGTWVIPVDEDDWLSPDLSDKILEGIRGRKTLLLRWDVLNIDQMGRTRLQRRLEHLYKSCSYAIELPCERKHISWNVTMSRSNSRSYYWIPDILAIKVDNLSSVSWLWKFSTQAESLIEIVKKRYFVKKEGVSPIFHSSVDRYNDLLGELYDSCKV